MIETGCAGVDYGPTGTLAFPGNRCLPSPSMAGSDAVESRLVVAIRPRPLAAGEPGDVALRLDCRTQHAVACTSAAGEEVLNFDRVFDAAAGNEDVYKAVAQPVVRAALRGINGAVAAYGQTSSGKTHTMRGTQNDPGVVPLAVRRCARKCTPRQYQRNQALTLTGCLCLALACRPHHSLLVLNRWRRCLLTWRALRTASSP